MNDTTKPSELAMEIADIFWHGDSDMNRDLFLEDAAKIGDLIAEHERKQWVDANVPPANERYVWGLRSTANCGAEVIEVYFTPHGKWTSRENGEDHLCILKWTEIVIPAPPKEGN